MADTKITGLTANTAPIGTDIMPMVDDPGGSALTQKVTITNLATAINALSGRVLISEQTPTGTGTLSWASIAATYKSLEIEYVARGTQVATNTAMAIYFNNDTTATNYRLLKLFSYGATVSTGPADTSNIGNITAASGPAGSCGHGIIKINNYASTTFNKQALLHGGYRVDTGTDHVIQLESAMEWESTVAINRVDLTLASGNYDTGSTFRLYGVF